MGQRYVYQAFILSQTGAPQEGAVVEVRDAADELAVIYDEIEGGAQKDNPFQIGANGLAKFYTESGIYSIQATFGLLSTTFDNVRIGAALQMLPAQFQSVELGSFFRGRVENLGNVSGEITLDWQAQTTQRMNITGPLDITFLNMPDAEAGEDQVMYFDITMDGDHAVTGDAAGFELVFPGGDNLGLTPNGRTFLVAAVSDGATIVVVYLRDIKPQDE
jgi:hypothetical protein